MSLQIIVAISAGGLVAVLAALAESLHARRVRRVGRLAFGPEARPRRWTRVLPPLRSLCLGAFAWALTALILIGSGLFDDPSAPPGSGTKHLVFLIDQSPSMYLPDAGAKHDITRRARLSEVVGSVLDRVGGDVTFTVVAFYTGALPVVSRTRDRAIVRNALDGIPLVYALGKGPTDLGLSISRSLELIEPFPRGSATVFVGTDGDTVALAQSLAPPLSVERTVILGVGDNDQGTFIDGHQSRQDAAMLRSVASLLHADYIDVNTRHVPTSALGGLVLAPAGAGGISLEAAARFVMILTSSILALMPVAQQYAGTAWRIPSAEQARQARAA